VLKSSQHFSLRQLPFFGKRDGKWPVIDEKVAQALSMDDTLLQALPKITIITPSYNQGAFLEETIRSVIQQGYPKLEYLIFDGRSGDSSIEIIKKYESSIAYWESKPDRGQAHAINKGLEMATGEICAYINSDDYYLPGVFWYVAETFLKRKWDLLIGSRYLGPVSVGKMMRRSEWKPRMLPFGAPFLIGTSNYSISQESTFWSAKAAADYRFDEALDYVLDVDWFCRISRGSRIMLTSKSIGFFREHSDSKTFKLQGQAPDELITVSRRWRPSDDEIAQATRVTNDFRRRLVLNTLKHLLSGPVEYIYTHPSCSEFPSSENCT
jgi:glycosyltransferase involved in cell wall biosynthesis